jgi:hypothetical protein
MVSAIVVAGYNEKQPIAYRTRKGPIASNVSLSCRLDRGDTARRSYNLCPVSDEAYRGKMGGLFRSLSENPLPLSQAFLPLAEGLKAGWLALG